MSEIIWAMNSRFDNTDNLVSYLRRYASEYLDQYKIKVNFDIQSEQAEAITIGGEKRRNVFLVLKEILHNSAKYANAASIEIQIKVDDKFHITVTEKDSKGFDAEKSLETGNGLFNCKKRMEAIGGSIQFVRSADDMKILITSPMS